VYHIIFPLCIGFNDKIVDLSCSEEHYLPVKHTFSIKKIHIILIIGLLHGLIYVFIMPPWQHYDEPGHFEYAWLIANRLKLPHVGDYDQNMRLAVGKSLIDSSFFAPGTQPNLTDPSKPIWMGIPQLVDPPLYYVIEAIPFFILKGAPINLQLYSGRIVSLLFLLLTIYSAYKLTQELTPDNHPLQWMVPLFISLLPALVELMSAINNFVAAIGLFSLWLWISVKLIKRFSLKYAGILILLTIACILTQKVLYPILVYLPIVLLLSIIPEKRKYITWIMVAIASLAALLFVFNWGDAALWFRANYQDFPSRVQIQGMTTDGYALQGKAYPDSTWGQNYPSWNPGFFQLVPIDIGNQLSGKTVTIGAWVWSDKNIHGYGPGLNSLLQFQDRWLGFNPNNLDEKPKFIASVIQLPKQQDRLQIWLRTSIIENQDAIIYYDGIVLVEGAWPVDTPPQFTDKAGSQGIWGNRPFTNLARNAQIQHAWPYMEPQFFYLFTSKIQDLTPTHISGFISLFLDVPGSKWYTTLTANVIFHTFWARFGWGQVALINNAKWFHPYDILLFVTLLGIIGTFVFGWVLFKWRKNEFGFLLIVIILTVLVALFYGVYIMGGALRYRPYIPTARYIYPAVVPISLFLVIGWHGLLDWATRLMKISSKVGAYLFCGFLIGLDLFSVFSVVFFFYKP
jgi:hypothetical protein